MKPRDQIILDSVKRWFEQVVLGLNLCPFARAPYQQDNIAFVLSPADDDRTCLSDLYLNLQRLDKEAELETILLICPYHLTSFTDYNQFLELGDCLLKEEGWTGIYQIASFHPDYRFAETHPDDLENWTNRSPFPLLHLLREDSINRAVTTHRDIDCIPRQNIERMQQLGETQLKTLFGHRLQAKKSRT